MKIFMENIRQNWMLIAFMTTMVLWYGSVNSRLNSVEAQQLEQATIQEKVDVLVTDVAVIKSESKTTNKSLENLQDKVDYIINNMRK